MKDAGIKREYTSMEEKVVKAKKTPEQKVDVQAFVSRKLNALNKLGGAKAERAMERVLKATMGGQK